MAFSVSKSGLGQLVRRAFSSSASAEGAGVVAAPRKRNRKGKNFFDVAQFLGDWGVGSKLSKTHWPPHNYYLVTRVNLYKDGHHGMAWGIFHDSGKPQSGEVQKIGGVNKRCWRYIEDPGKEWKKLKD